MKKFVTAKAREIGTSIRRIRRIKEIKQAAFARDIGISTVTLSLIENGKSDISLCLLDKICENLRIEMDDLLTQKKIA